MEDNNGNNYKVKIQKILYKIKWSTMSQEKLSGQTKLSFEKEMLRELEYKKLINNFAPQKQEK